MKINETSVNPTLIVQLERDMDSITVFIKTIFQNCLEKTFD